MSALIVIALIALAAWIAWWWFIGRNRPAYLPLVIDDDDPLMIVPAQESDLVILVKESPDGQED